MNDYDVAIIGSGLGGLACGAILSKNGYKVVVLKKTRFREVAFRLLRERE
jgi:all-trans-retinol 13,14-reductase